MKRLIAFTAVLCMMTTLTACASKSRRNTTLETDIQTATISHDAETDEEPTTEAATQGGTIEFDEDLDEALVGTWKYAYDDGLDAYYVIDSDHSMMSMIDLSELMFIKNGKLVLGEDDPSSTFSFKEKSGHLVAQVEKKVILDIRPKDSADTDEVQGDFDVFDSVVLPQEPTEPKSEDDEDEEDDTFEELHPILRFQDDKTYLIELGGCYSTEGKLVFLTNQKQLVMEYWFDEGDPDTLIVKDEEGSEIHLERSDALDGEDDSEDDE